MEEEMERKRKNGEDEDDPLALTLSPPLSRPKPRSEPSSSPPVPAYLSPVSGGFTPPAQPAVGPVPRGPRMRRNITHESRKGKSDKVEPPFPWSTNHRATVHTLEYLLSNGIDKISGEVQCKRCEGRETISYDLLTKFMEVRNFVAARKHSMHDRAPPAWSNPEFLGCRTCAQANCMKPVVAQKKRKINWLFMLLGQTLGCCTLEQLKYFCKHTKNHRTGAKDRVLYLTYLGLGKQLDPTGPFDVGH